MTATISTITVTNMFSEQQ